MKTVEVPVVLFFNVPDGTNDGDVSDMVERSLEYSSLRESFFAGVDQLAENLGWGPQAEEVGYDGFALR